MHSKVINKILLTIGIIFSLVQTSNASHVLGGEITYKYLDNTGASGTPYRYEVTIRVYNNRDGQVPDGIEQGFGYAIYEASNGAFVEYRNPSANLVYLNPDIPAGCVVPGVSNFRVTLNEFVDIIELPFSVTGYDIIWERGTRLNVIDNINQGGGGGGGGAGATFHAFIPSSIYANSSPQFTDRPIPAMCANDTTVFINNAFDPDGDQLVYRFVDGYDMNNWGGGGGSGFSPYNTPPLASIQNNYTFPPNLTYNGGYSGVQPFGTNGLSFINSSTGLVRYFSPIAGNFVVNVDIDEYRTIGGTPTLIATTRRELQIFVGNCLDNEQPVISSIENSNSSFINIYEGDSVHLTIETDDPEFDNVTIIASGAIIDSISSYTGPKATFTLNSSAGEGYFDWKTECGMQGSYQFVISAQDDGCPPKTNYSIYTVNILPFQASNILGADSVCHLEESSLFRASNSGSDQYVWSVINGTASAYNSDSSRIFIDWGNPGNGRIDLIETSVAGCKDTINRIINILDAVPVNALGDTTICKGDTVEASVSGSGDFLWTPTKYSTDSTANNTFLFPDTTTDFIIKSTTEACFLPDTVRIEVNEVPILIPDDTTCMRDTLIIGSSPLTGAFYNWTPGLNISDSTISQPSIWITKSGIFTYIVEVTDSNQCVDSDSVHIYVRQNPDSVNIIGGKSLCPDVTGIEYFTDDSTIVGYTWSTTGGVLASGQGSDSIIVDWGVANDSASVNIVATDIHGCIGDTSKYYVLINEILQTETPNGPDSLCSFYLDSIDYSITKINGSTYTWNILEGNINYGDSTEAVNINWNGNIGAYVFIQEAVNTSSSVCLGQSDTLFIILSQSPDTTLNINGLLDVCSFSDTVSYNLTGFNNSSYIWQLDSGGIITSGQGMSSINVDWDSTGNYPISVLEITENGCYGKSIMDTVTIRPIPNTFIPNANYDFIVCQNLDSIYYEVSGFSNSSYLWSISGGDSIESNTNGIYVNWNEDWIKELSAIETSEYGCIGDTLEIDITFDPSNVTMVSVSDNFDDETMIDLQWGRYAINDTLTDSTLTLYRRQLTPTLSNWDTLATLSKFELSYTDGSYNTKEETFQYYISTSNLCFDTLSTLNHKNVLLNVEGNEVDATTTLSWAKYSDWSKFDGVREYNIYRNLDDGGYELYNTTSDLDSVIEFTNAGDGFNHCYRIEAIQDLNDEITSWSNEICVDYIHDIHIYNALTPNNDGMNDFFYAKNIWLYDENVVEIYNRWGNLVYKQDTYTNDWNGGNLPDGTYYYVVKVNHNDEQLLFKGDLLLQR